jgi:hypothetical protein
MPKQLVINAVRSKAIKCLKCKKIAVRTSALSKEQNKNFMKELYHNLHGPTFGCFSAGYVYFVGDDNSVLKSLQTLAETYGIEYTNRILDIRLNPKIELERRIIHDILKLSLEDLLSQRHLCLLRKMRVAIPTLVLQSEKNYALIHDNQYFEGFFYSLEVFLSGHVLIRIDPKVVALVRYTEHKSGDFVIPQCLDVECENFENCQTLPHNSVMFDKLVTSELTCCRGNPKHNALVIDTQTGRKLVVPKGVLFIEARLGTLPYEETRSYSLKEPEGRKLYTDRFLDLMKTDNELILTAGENRIVFDLNLVESIYKATVSGELTEYSIVPDIEVFFGEGLSNIDPYEGLRNYGAYSFNKASDKRYHHPHPRIFALFPETQRDMRTFLERLKGGYFYYPGFKQDTNPYNTEIDYETFAIKDADEETYLERTKAKIENIRQDHPWKKDYLCLFSIPNGMPRFYDEIKDFCLARAIRSQMIRSNNVSRLGEQWYPLYNFSLSVYAKTGGTPWTIDSSYFDVAECYVGLALALRKQGKFASSRFFAGAADVFNAYGEHISFAMHQSAVDRNLKGLHVDAQFMEELINKAITRYEDKTGHPPSSILIHKPGHFIRPEIDGVRNAIAESGAGECFLTHVQHNSHYRSYDSEIENQVRRGTYFKTRIGGCVLFPTGYLEAKRKPHRMGTPKPVFLDVNKIDKTGSISRRISDSEIFGICRNYLAFTRIRWNMLGTNLREPLTIYAARKVADSLSRGFKSLEGIDIRDIL